MPGPDILAALVAGTKAKAGDLNDKFDSIKDWGSDIPLTDLADQDPGELLIANASGVVTGVTPAGAVTVTNAGATSITHYHDTAGDTSVGASYTTLISRQPAAGTYVVRGKSVLYNSASFEAWLQLVAYGGVGQLDYSVLNLPATAANYNATLYVEGKFTTDGSVICLLQGKGAEYLNGTPAGAQNKLTLIRVA